MINKRTSIVEKRLVDDFKKEFHDKLGYYPEVIVKSSRVDSPIPYMKMEELEEHFTSFLPMKFGKMVPLKSKLRYRDIVELRFIFCYLAYKLGYTSTKIGEFLNKRDHTTILYNIIQFKNLIELSSGFRDKYMSITSYINTKENEFIEQDNEVI